MACYRYGFVPDDYMRIFEYNSVEYEFFAKMPAAGVDHKEQIAVTIGICFDKMVSGAKAAEAQECLICASVMPQPMSMPMSEGIILSLIVMDRPMVPTFPGWTSGMTRIRQFLALS